MATIELNLEDLRQHVGKKSVSTDVVNPGPANLLRLALGRAEPEFKTGDPLPPAWLSLSFLPHYAPDELRRDGTPHDAGVVPPIPLPRRMFAGERVEFVAQIVEGVFFAVPIHSACDKVLRCPSGEPNAPGQKS